MPVASKPKRAHRHAEQQRDERGDREEAAPHGESLPRVESTARNLGVLRALVPSRSTGILPVFFDKTEDTGKMPVLRFAIGTHNPICPVPGPTTSYRC